MFLISTHLGVGWGGKCQTVSLSREGIRLRETEKREKSPKEKGCPAALYQLKKKKNPQYTGFHTFLLHSSIYIGVGRH